ncbi:4,5-DOPA dioxygenase extradiol [Xenorhabdus bovienii]|uniref:4,5-DOPA dioxygenase extradiol n=1 Tax=Xenorhabdus bovienii TaxID=40576 RepID=A0AAJ1J5T2_XENBV|nr:4,5-DOPA dioxygenase extradiol [Xenorhabdus bovienii]MDE1474669.1 4,5-DOPA dioxygenase extradiol [Xenorhabdus bovienii]MDE1476737.1 4,5-DOPA dioxygenase extradiol [Xenorhabdus bovienii]MDE1482143.1 4,5-DOPA dioxygenase extradiol [Xenorhabdus bovienii]MDE1494624.1 4,5-DOPA dioxygenase extradiol [Xenorhabdus bovienii]MDE9428919.1 4,5-DOPA dioxygenase extradiol [Xenorhabdus bovienii]
MSLLRIPALFVGHGSPMNALEDNRYSRAWFELGKKLPRPRAILVISAHWYTDGTVVTAMTQPRTIHDFGAFPQALHDMQYPAKGFPELAVLVQDILEPIEVETDFEHWGLDHGSWGILAKMYPDADIPVIQLSMDRNQPASFHYEIGKKLAVLRDEGVLIMGSGNVVHNLPAEKLGVEPYSWSLSFEQFVRESLTSLEEPHPLFHALDREDGKLSNPTPEHFLPLFYVMGTWDKKEPISTPVEGIEDGSLSMLSIQVG